MWFITGVLLISVIGYIITNPTISTVDILCLVGMGVGTLFMTAGTALELHGQRLSEKK